MNAIALNNLWTYLKSLGLTASNREWLAEHLHEVSDEEIQEAMVQTAKNRMKTIDQLSPELKAIIGFAKPLEGADDDINGDGARLEYLTDKYSL